jgi:uroporphyrinogen-III synthase
MRASLSGCTVALAEGRQLEELAGLLEKEGATVLRYPMVNILDVPDEAPVVEWLRELTADRFAYVILMTGEALRRLTTFADRAGLREAMIAALARTHTLARGPKPVKALRELGLAPVEIAAAPTTEGVMASLSRDSLRGKTIGLTLYGEPNPKLERFLHEAGATVRTVMPYVYAPSSDSDRVADLIQKMESGIVEVLVFTSSPQVDRLYEVAQERNLDEQLRRGLTHTSVAAVGPVVAETLRAKGAPVHICPEHGFVMKNLVQQIKRDLPPVDRM